MTATCEPTAVATLTDDELERAYNGVLWYEAQVGSSPASRARLAEIEAEIERRMPAYGEPDGD